MTEQQPANQPGPHYYSPPPQPGQVYGQPPAPPAQPAKKKAPTWAVVVAAVILGVCGIGTIAAIASGGTDDPGPAPGQREAPAEPAADKPDPPDPAFAGLDPDDIELSIKTLEKQCFGSAGCNIVFRIELAYDGPDLDPAVTYEVTYEITGGDDPYISTLTVTGTEYSTTQEEFLGTPSSSAELTATVTDVSQL